MDNLLYKGFVALDDLKNRDVKIPKDKDDYLMRKMREDGEMPPPPNSHHELLHYKLIVPKRSEYQSTKILNDRKSMLDYLTSKDNYFFQSENFEKKFIEELPKLLWMQERCEDIGDYVLLFPNPDTDRAKNLTQLDNNRITLAKSLEFFDAIFDTTYSYPFKRKFMDNLRKSFIDAFICLVENPILTEQEAKKISEGALKLNFSKICDILKSAVGKVFKKVSKHDSKANKSSSSKKSSDSKNASVSELPKTPKAVKTGATPKSKEVKTEKLKSAFDMTGATGKILDEVKKYPGQNDDPNKDPPIQPITPKLLQSSKGDKDSKLSESDERKIEIEKLKPRKVWAGGLYSNEKKAEEKENSPHYWHMNRDGNNLDMHTLMRRTICAALANQGFIMREIFVNHGENIAVILTLPETNMMKVAEDMNLSKAVEFGVADLMSLEPLDSKSRPLRVNPVLYDEQMWERSYGTQKTHVALAEINMIRKQICNLLDTDCNMKSIVRLCQGTWMEKDENAGIFESDQPDIEDWRQYLKYLQRLSMHMREIRLLKDKISYIEKEFYGNKRLTTQGNKNKRSIDKIDIIRLINRLVVRAFIESIEKCNRLRNLWDGLGIAPTTYSYEFRRATNRMRPRNRMYYELLWMDYSYTYPYERDDIAQNLRIEEEEEPDSDNDGEEGDTEPLTNYDKTHGDMAMYTYLFSKVERLKIIHYLVSQIIDLQALEHYFHKMDSILQTGVLKIFSLGIFKQDTSIFFPLHDRHITEGTDYHYLFKHLREVKEPYNKLISEKMAIYYQIENEEEANVPKQLTEEDANLRSDLVENTPHYLKFKNHVRIAMESKLDASSFKKKSTEAAENPPPSSSKFARNSSTDQISAALTILDIRTRFSNKYLSAIFDQYNGRPVKEGKMTTTLLTHFGKVYNQQSLLELAEISKYYSIPNDRLIDACLECLTTQATLRSCLLPRFSNLNMHDVRNFVELNNSYPIKKSFENTIVLNQDKFPERTMINYFGEKVTLYFNFVNFYRDRMVWISTFGFVIMGLQLLYQLNVVGFAVGASTALLYEVVCLLFCCFVVIWSFRFYIRWRVFEKEFAIRCGQDGVEETKEVRREFKGNFHRSIIDDKINSIDQNQSIRRRKLIISMIILAFICFATGLASYYILISKRNCAKTGCIFQQSSSSSSTTTSRILLIRKPIIVDEESSTYFERCFGNRYEEKEVRVRLSPHRKNKRLMQQVACNPVTVPTCDPFTLLCSLDPSTLCGKNPDGTCDTVNNPYCSSDCDPNTNPDCLEGQQPNPEVGSSNPDSNSEGFDNDYNPTSYDPNADAAAFSEKSPYVVETLDADGGDLIKNLMKFFDPNEILFNTLEFIRILIFQAIARKIIFAYTKWQNIKLQEDFENHLILSIGLYQLLNNATIIIIVALQTLTASEVPAIVDGERVTVILTSCIDNKCTQELSSFFMIYCILQIIWAVFKRILIDSVISSILSYIKPKAIKLIAMISHQLLSLKNPSKEKITLNQTSLPNPEPVVMQSPTLSAYSRLDYSPTGKIDYSQKKIQKTDSMQPADSEEKVGFETKQIADLIIKYASNKEQMLKDSQKQDIARAIYKFYIEPDSIYRNINKEIDYQTSSLHSKEEDQSGSNIDEYLPLFSCYSYSTLFGVIFPLSFISCWAISFIETILDRREILFYARRPTPQSAKTIGLWLQMIRTVASFSIWTNSFYVSFILYESKSMAMKLFTFLSMSILLSITAFVYYESSSGISATVGTLVKRTAFIKQYLFTNSDQARERRKEMKISTDFKMFGEIKPKKRVTDLLAFAQDFEVDYAAKTLEEQQDYQAEMIARKALDIKDGYQFIQAQDDLDLKNLEIAGRYVPSILNLNVHLGDKE